MNINYLKKQTIFPIKNIKNFQIIEDGYTNECYKIILKDGKEYFFRHSKNDPLTPRKQELYVMNIINDQGLLWFDINNGDMIKKWINGTTNFKWTNDLIKKFVVKIKKMHNTAFKVGEILEYKSFISPNDIDQNLYQKYLELTIKYQYLPKYLCHCDLNPGNIMLDNYNEIQIYDYEWARINDIYFELANFARESLNNEQMLFLIQEYQNIDKKIFQDYLFITSCVGLSWANNQEQNDKIKSYLKYVKERMVIIKDYIF